MSALLPCPFCGGEAKLVDDPGMCGVPFGLVVDHQPQCFFAFQMDEAAQVSAWNTRAESDLLAIATAIDTMWTGWDDAGPDNARSPKVREIWHSLRATIAKARALSTPLPSGSIER